MPLIGVVDPSHIEREEDEPGRLPKWFPLDEALARAAEGEPKLSPWPYELMRAAADEHQERDYISTTMLTGGCGRGKVLERKADYIGDIDSMYASLMGTLLHRTLEYQTRPFALAEWRFFTTFEVGSRQVEVSCSPDLLQYEGETGIWDWKKTETPPRGYYPYKGHRRQVEFNRLIVNRAEKWLDADGNEADLPFVPWDLVFKHLVLVYLTPKWPVVMQVEKTQEVKTPNNRTIKRRLPYVADDEEVLAELEPRLRAMVLALEAFPEWPDELTGAKGFEGAPGWACPGKPWCLLPNCLAKRWPNGLTWEVK